MLATAFTVFMWSGGAESDSTVTVTHGDFDMTCERSVDEGSGLACTLRNTSAAAQAWPVVGVLHLSTDDDRALVVGTAVDVELSVGGTPEKGVMWIGETLVGYSRLDVAGEAAARPPASTSTTSAGSGTAGHEMTIHITTVDDSVNEDAETFYVALGPDGSRGVGFLYDHRQAIKINASDAPSAVKTLNSLVATAGGTEHSLAATAATQTLTVGYEVTDVTFTAETAHERATMSASATFGASAVALDSHGATLMDLASGDESAAVPLSVGTTTVTLTVTAEDGTTATHVIDVVRGALGNATEVTVSADGFDLTCPASGAEGSELSCTLTNTNAAPHPWPVVAAIHSSSDSDRALIAEDPIIPETHPDYSKDLSLGEQVPEREAFNHGYGELFSGGSRSIYRTYGYEKFDWSGEAAANASRTVTIELHADPAGTDTDGATEVFYVALAPSGYSGFSDLIDNRVPVRLISPSGTNILLSVDITEVGFFSATLTLSIGNAEPATLYHRYRDMSGQTPGDWTEPESLATSAVTHPITLAGLAAATAYEVQVSFDRTFAGQSLTVSDLETLDPTKLLGVEFSGDLLPSGFSLSPTFSPDVQVYTAVVPYRTTEVTVAAVPLAPDLATTVITPADSDGQEDGHQVALAVGDAVVSFAVSYPGLATRTYAVTVTRSAPEGPVATFEQVPDRHDGSSRLNLHLYFDQEVELDDIDFNAGLLDISGGEVVSGRRLSGTTRVGWEVAVRPAWNGDVVITLPDGRACGTTGAVCNTSNQQLAASATATIPGPSLFPPTVTSGPALSAAENATEVATLAAADEDTAPGDLVWSIPSGSAGGRDAAAFTLTSGGVLSFRSPKNFESPSDTGRDGTYEVTVRVSDGLGAAAADLEVTVTDVNEAPSADAGLDRRAGYGAWVLLAGSGTDPDSGVYGSLSYSWAQTGGTPEVTLLRADTRTPTFAAPASHAVLTFTLTVTDGGALTGTDEVSIRIPTETPVVSTYSALYSEDDSTVVATLEASDPDTPLADLVWSIPAGAAGGADAALFSLSSGGELSFKAAPDFESPSDADRNGVYEVTVQVSDGSLSSTKALSVTVTDLNEAPSVSAGADQTVNHNARVYLNGFGIDREDGVRLTYSWVQTGGAGVTLERAGSTSPRFTAPARDAVLTFTLTVTDIGAIEATDEVTVFVTTGAPEVTTRTFLSVAENTTAVVSLEASDSDTAQADLVWSIPPGLAGGADGALFSVTPGGALSFKAARDFESFGDDAKGTGRYEVTVQVSDGAKSSTKTLSVAVTDVNEAPWAVAGADQAVNHGSAVSLAGWGSDPDSGDEADLTYSWAQTGGAPLVTLAGEDTRTPTFTAPASDAVLTFTLTVTDRGALTGTDEVVVTVTETNTAPTAEAGAAQTVAHGDAVTLTGSGTDPDAGNANALTYSWAQTSGSPVVSLSGQNTKTATFTAPSEDTVLTFTLTVTDQGSLTDTDEVIVTVQGLAPSVTTPAALSVTENTATVTTLAATDADTPQANLVWSIPTGQAGGADRAMFSLTSGGELSFNDGPGLRDTSRRQQRRNI